MDHTRVLVIGADAAGMSAAHQALRTARATGRELEVVALERSGHTSYSACGIPYWLAGDVSSGEDLVARTAEEHRAAGIDLRTGVTATALDLSERTVTCHDEDGHEQSLGYDELVIATGARPVIPQWAKGGDGSTYGGVGPVKDLDDGAEWLARMEHAEGPLVIAGGGYIGVEMAETAVRRGFTVTLITRSRVMSSLDPDMGARVAQRLVEAGVTVLENTTVEDAEATSDGWVRSVATSDGRTFACDLLVLALGLAPATEFAVEAGLPVGASGGLQPDPTGRVAPGVWAAGDCCEVRHRMSGEWAFLPLGTHANKAGRALGTNLGGGAARFDGALGTAITRFADENGQLEIARTGLGTAEADQVGIEARSLLTEGTTGSGYMPEAEPIAIRMFAEPGTRRLLGAQIIGGRGAGKRIDSVAAALWGGLSVDDLAWMDLSYAPPFATAWEVVQVAARRLADRL